MSNYCFFLAHKWKSGRQIKRKHTFDVLTIKPKAVVMKYEDCCLGLMCLPLKITGITFGKDEQNVAHMLNLKRSPMRVVIQNFMPASEG